jgi:L,D-peptidoglycan transpeptidase YkuD (ErfK/YbiS/YcfS/YnhG family)
LSAHSVATGGGPTARRAAASILLTLAAVVPVAAAVTVAAEPAGAALARPQPVAAVAIAVTADGGGYWTALDDGTVSAEGDAPALGDASGTALDQPIVGMAATPTGQGYWEVAADGGIFSFGRASFFGSMGGRPLDQPIVGMAATPTGQGYWEVAADGGMFSFGRASFFGSMGGRPLDQPIVGMAVTPTGQGYWEVAADGGIFSFGRASFFGSMGGRPLARAVVGMAAVPGGGGYYELGGDGGIFTFGDAAFHGADTLNLAQQLASTDGARQLVVVDAPGFSSTTATLTTWEDDGQGWTQALPAMPAVVGWSGWQYAGDRVEGDGATPIGIYPFGSTMYGNDPDPGVAFPYHQLVCGDWWDEDPSSPTYGTFQHVACGTTPPFGGESEALWTETAAYPYFAVIDFNTPPTGPFGSGIFLHADIGQPTDGCVSLPLGDLVSVLQWLRPTADPVIVMGPDSVVRDY